MGLRVSATKDIHDSAINNTFAQMTRATVEYAEMANCKLTALSAPDLPHFSKLPHSEKIRVLQSLKVFNEICREVLSDGKSLGDSPTFIWYGLKKLELRFSSDLFEYITNQNIVELYNRDNVQIFRNFDFFRVTSYTLEDLLCRPWVELFARVNPEHTQSLIDTCSKFYSRELNEVVPLSHVGVHRIIETDSPYSFKVDAVINYLAPLFDQSRNPVGCIAIETATLACDVPTGKKANHLLGEFYKRHM